MNKLWFYFKTFEAMNTAQKRVWELEDKAALRRSRFGVYSSGDTHICEIQNDDFDLRQDWFMVNVLMKLGSPVTMTSERPAEWEGPLAGLARLS